MSSAPKLMGLSMHNRLSTWVKSATKHCVSVYRMVEQREGPTVLHDVSDDSKLVKVSTSSFCSKRLLEGDLDVSDLMFVERLIDEEVAEAKDKDVLNHLFA